MSDTQDDRIFIGTTRPSEPPNTRMPDGRYADVLVCTCGQHLWTQEGVRQHWQQGHFDVPQYITREEAITRALSKETTEVSK